MMLSNFLFGQINLTDSICLGSCIAYLPDIFLPHEKHLRSIIIVALVISAFPGNITTQTCNNTWMVYKLLLCCYIRARSAMQRVYAHYAQIVRVYSLLYIFHIIIRMPPYIDGNMYYSETSDRPIHTHTLGNIAVSTAAPNSSRL